MAARAEATTAGEVLMAARAVTTAGARAVMVRDGSECMCICGDEEMCAWVGEVACAFAGMVWVQITATHLWAPGPATRDPPRHDEENRTSLEAAEMWAATAAAEGVTSEEAVASRADVAMGMKSI